mmetsp:Transcript_17974/g.53844  ORF Transcript_17974/g.53844 Transcript_17974/m.53844 type:complete len:214 (+) Transcript_17974:251-892(+)
MERSAGAAQWPDTAASCVLLRKHVAVQGTGRVGRAWRGSAPATARRSEFQASRSACVEWRATGSRAARTDAGGDGGAQRRGGSKPSAHERCQRGSWWWRRGHRGLFGAADGAGGGGGPPGVCEAQGAGERAAAAAAAAAIGASGPAAGGAARGRDGDACAEVPVCMAAAGAVRRWRALRVAGRASSSGAAAAAGNAARAWHGRQRGGRRRGRL